MPGSNTPANSNGQMQQRPGPSTLGGGGDTWDEERLEQALERLKELHIQVSYVPLPIDLPETQTNSSCAVCEPVSLDCWNL